MKRLLFFALFIMPLFSTLSGQSITEQFERRSHTAYNKTIPYRLFIPDNYSDQSIYPLIMILHGSGSRGNDNEQQLLWTGATAWAHAEIQDENSSFIVVPQCPSLYRWHSHLDILSHLLISLMEEYSIDSTRLYLSGYSMGGAGTWDMISMSEIPFAAAIPVAGGGDEEILPLLSYIPSIWNFHGINDLNTDVHWSRDMIYALEDVLGISAVYPVLKHGTPTEYSEEELDSVLQTSPQLIYSETTDSHSSILEPAYLDSNVSNWMFSKTTEFLLPSKSPSPTTAEFSNLSHVTVSPVLYVGELDSWDNWAVSEPSVIMDRDTLKMWYIGWEEGWGLPTQVGHAWSLDGIRWSRYADNPILSADLQWEGIRINRVSVIKDENTYRMWYSAGDRSGFPNNIGYAWSEDGIIWTKYSDPVLTPGNIEEWDYFNISVGTVIKEEAMFKMWYHGGTWMTGMQIGYATSIDGINWIKHNSPETDSPPYHVSDPVMTSGLFPEEWDFHSVWFPIVLSSQQGYEMWYSGSTLGSVGFLHYATSSDGISWFKSESNPVLSHPPEWGDRSGYIGGSVLKYEDEYHLWYSNYHYQTGQSAIGYAKDYSNIAHSDSFIISDTFLKPGTDTLEIMAWVVNPFGHSLELNAHILSEDSLIDYYLQLDSGENNTWRGQWPIPGEERTYEVYIQTTDLDSGTVHNTIRAKTQFFTSIGPIIVERYDVPLVSTNAFVLELYMMNTGSQVTAKDIRVHIVSTDTNITDIYENDQVYGDISAGEIKSSSLYAIYTRNDPDNVYLDVQIYSGGIFYWKDSIVVDLLAVEEKENDKIPLIFELEQNYPNPFNPKTMINYQLPMTNNVELSVYNLLGQRVAILVNKRQKAGYHQIEWDASGFASGIYYYSIEAGEFQDVKKMILLK
jgi:predicted GH43/DUF377 family glycosyl hydrolase/predicted esterase